MRSMLVLFFAGVSVCAAQDAGLPTTLPGTATRVDADSAAEISVEVRLLTASPSYFENLQQGRFPHFLLPMDELSLAEPTDAEIREAAGGLKLIETRTVREIRPEVFLQQVSREELRNLITTAQSNTRSNIVFAPKLTIRDGQVVEVYAAQTGASIDVVPPSPDGVAVSRHPFNDAVRFMIRTRVLPDQTLRLDFKLRQTRLSEEDGEQEAEGRSTRVVNTAEVAASAILAPGESLAAWGFDYHPDGPAPQPKRSAVRLLSGVLSGDSGNDRAMKVLLLITPSIVEETGE